MEESMHGAESIERHFTIDKTWKGTDHSASLEPQELTTLVRDLNNVQAALQYKKNEILDIELVQKRKLKFIKELGNEGRLEKIISLSMKINFIKHVQIIELQS